MVLAHTLGNPFDLGAVTEFVRKHDLWLVEDCCDAGRSDLQQPESRYLRRLGDSKLLSRAPHHDGRRCCVLTSKPLLTTLVESFRDWGRDCWCEPGKANTCGKRFDWQLGDLPCGYDHKYTYSHIGYNLKLTDMQAAVGLSQLGKLRDFIARRRANFQYLYRALSDLNDVFILPRQPRKRIQAGSVFP